MKRAFVLVALFAMMLALQSQGVDLMSGASEPLILASIGFTALFAFTIGEVVSALGLPRVSGYILTGVILGPHVAKLVQLPPILSLGVVDEMKMFNTLALGLIATSAGLELDIKATAKVGRTLLFTVVTKLVALLVLVGGTFVAIQEIFSPFDIEGIAAIGALATVIAVLGLGTSPAIVLAVINDSKAKGRMADLVLAIAVVKDLVVVVSLAVALAVAKALLSPDGSFDPHVLLAVGEELGVSILVGAAVGAAIWAYIRYVHTEMLLFVVAMILTVAQISEVLHLELLLVFIVAGFLIRNFSDFEHELLHPLELVALPVFVVFFTTAGANIDLEKTWAVLPVALALFLARLLALFIAGRVGGQLGGEDEPIKRAAWLTYVPQAGVTLGLVLIASKALPEYRELIDSLGVALVALNLFIGPVTLGMGLSAGAPKAAPQGDGHPLPDGMQGPEESPLELQAVGPAGAAAGARAVDLAVLPASLAAPLARLREELGAIFEADAQAWEPHRQALHHAFEGLTDPALEPVDRQRALRRFARRPPPGDASAAVARLERALTRIDRALGEMPNVITVPLEPAHLSPRSGAGRAERLKTTIRRWQVRMRPDSPAAMRRVPARTATRIAFEGRLFDTLTGLEDIRHRCHAQLVADLEPMLSGHRDAAETAAACADRLEATVAMQRMDTQYGLDRALANAVDLFARADSPSLPADDITYGDVEPQHTAARARLLSRPPRWAELLNHQHGGLLLHAWLLLGRRRVQDIIHARFLDQLTFAADAVVQECDRLVAKIDRITTSLSHDEAWTPEGLQRLAEETRQVFGRRGRHRVRNGTARFRQQALLHPLLEALHRLVEEAPDEMFVIAPDTPLETAADLDRVHLVKVRFHAILQHQLGEHLQPALIGHHGAAMEHVGSAHLRLTESVHVAIFAMEMALKGTALEHEDTRNTVQVGLKRARERVSEFSAELRASVDAVTHDIDARLEETLLNAEREAFLRRDSAGRLQQGRSTVSALQGQLRRTLAEVRKRLSRSSEQAQGAAQRLLTGHNVRALRIRSGLERLDPAQMGAWIDEHLPAPESLDLPSLYKRLFGLGPLDDRRFFVHHRGQPYERLLEVLKTWGRGGRAAVMIHGPGGSGKTSLLNLLQLELGVDRLIRLDPQFSAREEGVLGALAADLDCEPDVDLMEATLKMSPSAVLIDGLEHWFLPTLAGVEALERLQQLIVRTCDKVLWVVTASSSALHQIEQLTACRKAFSHHVALRPLDGREAARLIEQRHQLSGLTLSFDAQAGSRIVPNLRGSDRASIYYKRLANQLHNPRAIAYAHALASRSDEHTLTVGQARDLSIPFIPHLGDDAITLLVELYRLGAMSPRTLDAHLRLPDGRSSQLVGMLTSARLLERPNPEGNLTIPLHLRDAVALELESLGRLPREAR